MSYRTTAIDEVEIRLERIEYFKPELINIVNENPNFMKTLLNIKKSPFGLLLFAAITLLFAIGFAPIARIDFHGKTMFNAPILVVLWTIPLVLVCVWLVYLLSKRFLYSTTITWLHVLVTVSSTILIVAVMYVGINQGQPTSESQVELIGNTMQILFIVFVLGQLTFLANVLLGLCFKRQITP